MVNNFKAKTEDILKKALLQKLSVVSSDMTKSDSKSKLRNPFSHGGSKESIRSSSKSRSQLDSRKGKRRVKQSEPETVMESGLTNTGDILNISVSKRSRTSKKRQVQSVLVVKKGL